MSMHLKPLTSEEEAGLRAHGLPVGVPSQLADAFRLGVAWAEKAGAEAALAAPQPDADGWIPWVGGECPPAPDAFFEVKLRDGMTWEGEDAQHGDDWVWFHDGDGSDIIAYRLVEAQP